MSNKIIQSVENEYMKSAKTFPSFGPGDTIVVQVKVVEGERSRLQSFEGVVIAKRNRGFHSAFTVRKISHGVGVERVFICSSPNIESITVKRRGDVRRAKLYYMRELSGRAARIKEKLTGNARAANAAALANKEPAKAKVAEPAKAEKVAEKPVEKKAEKKAEKPAEKKTEKAAPKKEAQVDKKVEKPTAKKAEKKADKKDDGKTSK